jgi:dTDP-4-dehydrorhamnose reductase
LPLSKGKILVLGGSGFIGRHLRARLAAEMGDDRVVATYNGTPFSGGLKFDAQAEPLAQVVPGLETFSHAVILLANAHPDDCARNPEASRALNVTAIKAIIDQLAESGVRPVFASTEVVFDGQKGNYVESDPVSPILLYGKQKAEIEEYLVSRVADSLILRIANVYGSDPAGSGVMAGWFRTVSEGAEAVKCARDYTASPVHVDDVAEAVIRLMEEGRQGIYNVAGPHPLSRLEMFETLLEEMRRAGPVDVEVVSCSINDFPTEEKRPRDVSLKLDKLVAATGLEMRTLRSACCDLVAAAS